MPYPEPTAAPVPRLWRARQALILRAIYDDLDAYELADLLGDK